MAGVEFVVILTMRALYFSIVAGRIRTNKFMLNTKTLQGALKERWLILFSGRKAVNKLKAVVGLDTFNRNSSSLKPLYGTLFEICR